MNFSGKIVLITGAAGGLGKELTREFAGRGSTVIMTDVDATRLEEACEDLRNAGAKVDCKKCDVTDQEDVEELVDHIKKKYQFIDVLVNNAGILNSKGFDNGTYADYEKIINVNVNGYARMLFNCLPLLGRDVEAKRKTMKEGTVIVISSIASFLMIPELQFYCISKAATSAMARAVRQSFVNLGLKGMNVLNVNPPQFDTTLWDGSSMVPWIDSLRSRKKLPSPSEMARKIVKAAGKGRKNLNLTFLTKISDAGARAFPGSIDTLARKIYHEL